MSVITIWITMTRSITVHLLTILAVILSPAVARAEFIGPLSSAGGVDFQVRIVDGPSAASVFGASGELLSAGEGYPILQPIVPPSQTIGGGIAAPVAPISGPGLSATANPALIDGPGQFGAGQVSMFAATFSGVAGVFWSNVLVADASANGFASINYSRGVANFVSIVDSRSWPACFSRSTVLSAETRGRSSPPHFAGPSA
jgi:hypothetical protein